MPLPDVADTYRLDLKQVMNGEELHNVFFYRDTAILVPAAMDIGSDWWDAVKAVWRAIVPSTMSYSFVEVNVQALFAPYSFATFPIPIAEQGGTRAVAGDPLPQFVAMYIELVVGTRATRPGGKRIAGWTETDIVGQLFVNAAVTLGQNLATVLDGTFTVAPPGAVMTPVIVGYPTPPPTSRPLRVQDVIGSLVDQNVSHQVSRDPRRR